MSGPWLKFYPSDWRSDPALRMCGLAARGLWIEMLALMHEAVPAGHLVVAGRCPTDAQLAVLAGTTPDQIPDLIGELEAAAVFSRTKEGVIYSRRMLRDTKKAATARKNGAKGGNPNLGKDREKPEWDNPSVKGDDKPQKPEARSQKIGSSEPIKPRDALCEVVSAETAEAFIAMRKAIRAPLTAKAAQLIAADLRGRPEAEAAMLKSIKHSWRGVFPDDQQSHHPSNGGSNDQPALNRQAAASDTLRRQLAVVGRSRPSPSEGIF